MTNVIRKTKRKKHEEKEKCLLILYIRCVLMILIEYYYYYVKLCCLSREYARRSKFKKTKRTVELQLRALLFVLFLFLYIYIYKAVVSRHFVVRICWHVEIVAEEARDAKLDISIFCEAQFARYDNFFFPMRICTGLRYPSLVYSVP